MYINFTFEGETYRARYLDGTIGGSGVGCHSRVLTNIGSPQFHSLEKVDRTTGLHRPVNTVYGDWGSILESGQRIIERKFRDNPKELKDLLYSQLVELH